MALTVPHEYISFIEGLEKPMKLNEMRNMKEPNYSKLRGILRDPALYGDLVLRSLREVADEIGLGLNAYHMVYEGFWDLYCRKPASSDLNAKKLEGWINKVNLLPPAWDPVARTPATPATPLSQEAPEKTPDRATLDHKCVARIRIPLKRPTAEEGEENAEEQSKAEAKEDVPLEEIETEDKVLQCNP